MLDEVTKLLCPIWFGSQRYEALVLSSRQMCVHKALMDREERLFSDLCCPLLRAFILLLKPLGSSHPWQSYLARAKGFGCCQRIYKRKAKLHFIAAIMALHGNGTKQHLFRWQWYLLRGLQVGEQSAHQCVYICSSTLLQEMWCLDSLRVTSTEGLKL